MPRTIAPTIIPPFRGTCHRRACQSIRRVCRTTGPAGATAITRSIRRQSSVFGPAQPAELAPFALLQQSIRLVHYLHHGSTSADFFWSFVGQRPSNAARSNPEGISARQRRLRNGAAISAPAPLRSFGKSDRRRTGSLPASAADQRRPAGKPLPPAGGWHVAVSAALGQSRRRMHPAHARPACCLSYPTAGPASSRSRELPGTPWPGVRRCDR